MEKLGQAGRCVFALLQPFGAVNRKVEGFLTPAPPAVWEPLQAALLLSRARAALEMYPSPEVLESAQRALDICRSRGGGIGPEW